MRQWNLGAHCHYIRIVFAICHLSLGYARIRLCACVRAIERWHGIMKDVAFSIAKNIVPLVSFRRWVAWKTWNIVGYDRMVWEHILNLDHTTRHCSSIRRYHSVSWIPLFTLINHNRCLYPRQSRIFDACLAASVYLSFIHARFETEKHRCAYPYTLLSFCPRSSIIMWNMSPWNARNFCLHRMLRMALTVSMCTPAKNRKKYGDGRISSNRIITRVCSAYLLHIDGLLMYYPRIA